MIILTLALQIAPPFAPAVAAPAVAAPVAPAVVAPAAPLVAAPLVAAPLVAALSAPASSPMPRWFARVSLGVGPSGFSKNASLLRELGHAPPKLWAAMDGAYAVHSRVGVGLWFGLSRGASRRGGDYRFNGYSPELVVEEAAYFAAAQLPVRVWGNRDLAIELVPRAGFATGSLELSHDAENNDVPQSIASGGTTSGPVSKNAPAQNTVVFGAAITLTSYTYHLGLDTGLLFAPVGPPGELARAHDFGGFYFAFGGTIDG